MNRRIELLNTVSKRLMQINKALRHLSLLETYMDRPGPYEADRILIRREPPPLYGTHMDYLPRAAVPSPRPSSHVIHGSGSPSGVQLGRRTAPGNDSLLRPCH